MKKFLIIVFILIIGAVFLLQQNFFGEKADQQSQATGPVTDPFEVTLDFYNEWHTFRSDTNSTTTAEQILNSPLIDESLRTRLQSETANQSDKDPILCQYSAPPRVGAKLIYSSPESAQVMILARGLKEKAPEQAVVSLVASDGKWVINDITCVAGDTAPDRDYTFEQDGFLLKSVPPPLAAGQWHLVFKESGVDGHTTPLYFNDKSTCIDLTGTESVCLPDQFIEPSKVFIQGEMTETGVLVSRVKFE